jgi:hypothetical protein
VAVGDSSNARAAFLGLKWLISAFCLDAVGMFGTMGISQCVKANEAGHYDCCDDAVKSCGPNPTGLCCAKSAISDGFCDQGVGSATDDGQCAAPLYSFHSLICPPRQAKTADVI